MRRLVSSALLFVAVGLTARSSTAGGTTTEVIEALSAIDFLPGTVALEKIMGDDLTDLTDVANGNGDTGVRLRAYRSLGQFNTQESRNALVAGIDRYRGATRGTDLLMLIAAAEGLGEIAGPTDVATLGPLLDAPSRDLRTVVARALGHVANPAACTLLRNREPVEQSEQVMLAINAAQATCP